MNNLKIKWYFYFYHKELRTTQNSLTSNLYEVFLLERSSVREEQQEGNYETNTAQIFNANVSHEQIRDMQILDI